MIEQNTAETFHARLKGRFYGMLQWQDLDVLWGRVKTGQWFFYQVGEELPERTLGGKELAVRIDALDQLLRQDHDFHLCGIVYADHVEQPTLIKVYDPSTLGSMCGSSAAPTPPRWVLSTSQPAVIESHVPAPNNRRRWWQLFQSA
ncbi:MAG: hypothetical protein HY799_07665 [Nitrosomonadales bacterium]|nr:hypothetical protein [Nitrosomonadales bacterium]